MDKRGYRKYTDIYAEFERFCRERLQAGVPLAPPERALAELFAASRMTVRKVLAEAETAGLIRRDGHQIHILPGPCLAGCGRITYFVQGQDQIIVPPAFERLWLVLKPLLQSAGADLRLFQFNRETKFDDLRRAAEQSDVVLLTILGNEPFLEYLYELQKKKCVIALSDPHLERFDKIISLDNYAVGAMAADTLREAGCRSAAVCGGFDHPIFNKRRQGFADRWQRLGGRFFSYPFPPPEISRKIPDCAASLVDAYRRGFAGIFILSDEWMDEITAPVYQLGVVPDKFKILSFNGSGDSLLCSPTVSVLNRGSAEVADTIMQYLARAAAARQFTGIRAFIKPHLYKNQTIG